MLDSPGACPVCRGPLPEGRTVCSGKCRAALSRQRRAEALAERDRRLRVLAEAMLRELGDDDRHSGA